jgi:hypothetical protein
MLIREHRTSIAQGDRTYSARICGEQRVDGTWEGWLEFHPVTSTLPILHTDQETSQPIRAALEYWAEGLSRSI